MVSKEASGSFGPNAWLVDDMYDRFLVDPGSVSESWQEFFAGYQRSPVPAATHAGSAPASTQGAEPASDGAAPPVVDLAICNSSAALG